MIVDDGVLGLLVAVVAPGAAVRCPRSVLVKSSVGGADLVSSMCDGNLVFMSWNVRGLNCPAKHTVVSDVASSHRVAVLCLQETKIVFPML